MKYLFKTAAILFVAIMLSSYTAQEGKATYSLTIEVKDLRNSNGVVQYALYNRDGTIPDDKYKDYYKILKGKIINGTSTITFYNLPEGKYAVNILHDEDEDGKIKRGLVLPKEGIGFSNYQSIGLTNRPNFSKASFELKENKSIQVKVIYLKG